MEKENVLDGDARYEYILTVLNYQLKRKIARDLNFLFTNIYVFINFRFAKIIIIFLNPFSLKKNTKN